MARVTSTIVLTTDTPGFILGEPTMPGGMVPPFVPLDMIREGFLDVEVRTK